MFTIGYQGATLKRLVETLAAAGVSVLVDTRDSPTSRRPEFRPSTMEAALADADIRYLAASALGAPRELRALAIRDWESFAEGYRRRLDVVRKELEVLFPLFVTERVCFLCFEAEPGLCHRSLLADEIEALLNVPAVHLRPGRPNESDNDERMSTLGEITDDEMQVALG